MNHIPVLLNEVLQIVTPTPNCHILDCTFGRGGYTSAFLNAGASVTALDRDPTACESAQKLSQQYPDQFKFIQERFSQINTLFKPQTFDAVIFDIGVSSPQIDTAERGFSFNKSGPLDMRMGSSDLTAADIVNTYSQEALSNLFYHYGEEKRARKFARLICEYRLQNTFETTDQLANLISEHTPKFFNKKKKIHPATLVFQALRIAVNDELNEFEHALNSAHLLLNPNGRLVSVTFHSLEDRIAKHYLKKYSFTPKTSKYESIHTPEPSQNLYKLINKKPITAQNSEIKHNPRASCAKLRAATRTDKVILSEI